MQVEEGVAARDAHPCLEFRWAIARRDLVEKRLIASEPEQRLGERRRDLGAVIAVLERGAQLRLRRAEIA